MVRDLLTVSAQSCFQCSIWPERALTRVHSAFGRLRAAALTSSAARNNSIRLFSVKDLVCIDLERALLCLDMRSSAKNLRQLPPLPLPVLQKDVHYCICFACSRCGCEHDGHKLD